MGSVKEIIEESAPFKGMLGKGSFLFSDDYSVFDWGKMPDSVPGKGAVLCMLGAFNFRLLEREGIRTHYLGLMEEGKVQGKMRKQLFGSLGNNLQEFPAPRVLCEGKIFPARPGT